MARFSSLYVGCVVKMNPTQRSHVKLPYFAKVKSIEGMLDFTLTIPGEHDLKVNNRENRNLDYQLKRMELIGTEKDYGHLLHNQTFE